MQIIYNPHRIILTATLSGSIVGLIGCFGVSSQDGGALVDASKLSYSALQHSDGGAERVLIRAEHCAVEGVLRRNKIDSGVPDIGCNP